MCANLVSVLLGPKLTANKKVLLRERKRHTARRVVSTPSVVLPGYPPPPGGVPDQGTPPGGVPDPGTPPGGYLTWVPPLGGYLTRVPPRGTRVPPQGGTWPGYPPGGYLTRVPPRGGTWLGYPPGGTWPGYPPGGVPDPGTPRGGTWPGYPPGGVPGPPLPPGVDRQTKWNYYLPVVLRTRAVISHQLVQSVLRYQLRQAVHYWADLNCYLGQITADGCSFMHLKGLFLVRLRHKNRLIRSFVTGSINSVMNFPTLRIINLTSIANPVVIIARKFG